MGLYAEPKDNGPAYKYRWIKEHGTLGGTSWEDCLHTERLPVMFMDNGAFQALAIAWDKREHTRLAQGRPDGIWFTVSKADLRTVVSNPKMKELR